MLSRSNLTLFKSPKYTFYLVEKSILQKRDRISIPKRNIVSCRHFNAFKGLELCSCGIVYESMIGGPGAYGVAPGLTFGIYPMQSTVEGCGKVSISPSDKEF